jgi:hypothetical protein
MNKRKLRVDLRATQDEVDMIERLVKRKNVNARYSWQKSSRTDCIMLAVKFALGEADMFKDNV